MKLFRWTLFAIFIFQNNKSKYYVCFHNSNKYMEKLEVFFWSFSSSKNILFLKEICSGGLGNIKSWMLHHFSLTYFTLDVFVGWFFKLENKRRQLFSVIDIDIYRSQKYLKSSRHIFGYCWLLYPNLMMIRGRHFTIFSLFSFGIIRYEFDFFLHLDYYYRSLHK